MKIKDLEVQNVRSYKSLSLSLSPFLNVFKGVSDAGKSGFIKTLLFVVRNLVTKKTRTNNCTEESFAKISDGEVSVKRVKDDKGNFYELVLKDGSKKDFSAFKEQIPEDVKTILNLSESNIQTQRDTYFLIDKPAGVVSKTLNKVSGLTEIDTTIKAINARISDINANIRKNNSKIGEYKKKIEGTKWSIKADSELLIIEDLDFEISDLKTIIDDLSSSVDSYKFTKNKIDNLLPDSLLVDYREISDIIAEIGIIEGSIGTLTSMVDVYKESKNKHNNFKEIDLSELREVERINTEIETLIDEIESLKLSISTYKYNKGKMEVVSVKIKELLSKVKICPTCGKPMDSGECDD